MFFEGHLRRKLLSVLLAGSLFLDPGLSAFSLPSLRTSPPPISSIFEQQALAAAVLFARQSLQQKRAASLRHRPLNDSSSDPSLTSPIGRVLASLFWKTTSGRLPQDRVETLLLTTALQTGQTSRAMINFLKRATRFDGVEQTVLRKKLFEASDDPLAQIEKTLAAEALVHIVRASPEALIALAESPTETLRVRLTAVSAFKKKFPKQRIRLESRVPSGVMVLDGLLNGQTFTAGDLIPVIRLMNELQADDDFLILQISQAQGPDFFEAWGKAATYLVAEGFVYSVFARRVMTRLGEIEARRFKEDRVPDDATPWATASTRFYAHRWDQQPPVPLVLSAEIQWLQKFRTWTMAQTWADFPAQDLAELKGFAEILRLNHPAIYSRVMAQAFLTPEGIRTLVVSAHPYTQRVLDNPETKSTSYIMHEGAFYALWAAKLSGNIPPDGVVLIDIDAHEDTNDVLGIHDASWMRKVMEWGLTREIISKGIQNERDVTWLHRDLIDRSLKITRYPSVSALQKVRAPHDLKAPVWLSLDHDAFAYNPSPHGPMRGFLPDNIIKADQLVSIFQERILTFLHALNITRVAHVVTAESPDYRAQEVSESYWQVLIRLIQEQTHYLLDPTSDRLLSTAP